MFKDIDSIQLGDDFADTIMAAVGSCAVLLAIIGERWLTVVGPDGRKRLDDPRDFVRLEIETALTRGVRVIPVLVDGAYMPDPADLPSSLKGLTRRQALQLDSASFNTSRLLNELDKYLSRFPVAPAMGASSQPATGDVDQMVWRPRRHTIVLAAVSVLLAVAGIVTALLTLPYSGLNSSPGADPSILPTIFSPSVSVTRTSTLGPEKFTVCIDLAVSCTAAAMRVKPATIGLSADGGIYIKNISWKHWGSATAVGSGTLERNNCRPDCANGTSSPYHATVTLSDLTPWGGDEEAYAVMTAAAPQISFRETFSTGLVP